MVRVFAQDHRSQRNAITLRHARACFPGTIVTHKFSRVRQKIVSHPSENRVHLVRYSKQEENYSDGEAFAHDLALFSYRTSSPSFWSNFTDALAIVGRYQPNGPSSPASQFRFHFHGTLSHMCFACDVWAVRDLNFPKNNSLDDRRRRRRRRLLCTADVFSVCLGFKIGSMPTVPSTD